MAIVLARRIEQRAELALHGGGGISADGVEISGVDFNPDVVTQYLGIEPTRVSRRGHANTFGSTSKWTAWSWETPRRVGPDSEPLLIEVLEMFEPRRDALRGLITTLRLEVVIGLVIDMYGLISADADGGGSMWADVPTPGAGFGRDTIRRLASLGCALDIDQYVHAESPD